MPFVPRNSLSSVDATQVSFIPSISVDWESSPSTVQMALDELAGRSYNAFSIEYTPSDESLSCWIGSSEPASVGDALDQVALRLCDIEANPILYYIFDIHDSPPSNPAIGQFYYNSSTNLTYFYNGSTWVSMSGTGGTADHGLLTGLSDDDHSQYIFETPATSSRNTIAPTVADVTSLTVKASSGSFSSAHDVFSVQTSGSTGLMSLYRSASSTFSFILNTNAASAGTLGYIKMDAYSGRVTGYINTSAGTNSDGGYISTVGSSFGSAGGGNIDTHGYGNTNCQGGNIYTYAGTAANCIGGSITTFGGSAADAAGGIINTRGQLGPGGSIKTAGSSVTSAGGGTLDATAYGSQFAGNIYTFSGSNVGVIGGAGGNIDSSGGDGGAEAEAYGGSGGNIYTYGGNGSAFPFSSGGQGGSISMYGADGPSLFVPGGNGGSLNTYGYQNYSGGSISSNAGSSGAGGSINISDGGGSIVTNANTSYIQFGRSAQGRVTLRKTSGAATDLTLTIPQPGSSSYNVVVASGSQVANNFAVANSTTLGDVVFRNITASDLTTALVTSDAVVINPTSSSRNVIQPSGNYIPLVVKGHSSQSFDLFQVVTNSGGYLMTVSSGGDLWLSGNLTVMGVTTTINTQNVLIEDNFITLNSVAYTVDSGIEIERNSAGTGDNAFLRFKESVDQQWYLDNGTYEWIVGRKATGTITGNGSSTSFNISHNMSTKNVIVQVYDSTNLLATTGVDTSNSNYVAITFKVAPGNGVTYRVVIMG